jgi:hypothetical protein
MVIFCIAANRGAACRCGKTHHSEFDTTAPNRNSHTETRTPRDGVTKRADARQLPHIEPETETETERACAPI